LLLASGITPIVCARAVFETEQLAGALREHRHLRGPLVLTASDGGRLSEGAIVVRVRRAARQAGLENTGPHILRHSFVRTWQCAARPRERFKSSPGNAT
jgi:integrase